ncbi:FtsW/RodA/SpoVE family cell cycle protein [Megasphaera sp. UPII 135-E]|uniref:FtsW/RodA/SpoVE family cell cycle protein n=1 Tax=Megasphaera sp. UPII 135-E TaxID=1000569 RepID=UPI00021A26F5|nr:FtsW/RodA/SpoVE family cell cycle protein [Megasphaera sp. UPII 135-E]EGS31787.1 putative stage V sporulation protein E [Megasphaera sp. UPII 135-E]
MKRKSKSKSKRLQQYFFWLLVSFALLIVIGTVNVYSATFVTAPGKVSMHGYLYKQLGLIAGGIVGGFFAYYSSYKNIRRFVGVLIIVTFICLVIVLGAGVVVKGARRWIAIAGITFQPSEFAKITGIIFSAKVIAPSLDKVEKIRLIWINKKSHHCKGWKKLPILVHPAIILSFSMAFFVMIQPDAGTAMVILGIPICMLWISGMVVGIKKSPFSLAAFVGGIICIAAAIASEGYRMKRLVSWIDPWKYQATLGYQATQSFIAIGSGGVFGQGVGNGISKFNYLPEAHTDFAFAILAQEWGIFGSILVISLFAIILILGFRIVFYCRDSFGKLLALGIVLYFSGQGIINIGMNCGIFPVIGVPLPFISYGGTSLVMNIVMAALLLNVCHQSYEAELKLEREAVKPVFTSLRRETQSRFIPGK